MALERYRKSPSGSVLRVGQGDAAYQAFVPNPLPPTFTMDSNLINTLSAADRALGELAGLSRMLPNPRLLVQPFIRQEAVLSSRIEGTQADLADLYAYEAGQLSLPGFASHAGATDVREVHNYVRALEYGLSRLESLPVSLRLIRELHEQLMRGVRGDQATPGEFRRSQNWIGRPGCTLRTAAYVPPPMPEMHGALDALEKYLHQPNGYPPLVRLALVHYEFEAIHPFLDGNGRVGRLLISLLLVHWKLLPVPLLYLSAYFERRREEYYGGLTAVSERGAWAEWVGFFLRGVTVQAGEAARQANRLLDLQADWRTRLAQTRASSALLLLADSLFNSPVITIPEAQRLLEMSYNGARLSVHKLVQAGIVRQLSKPGQPKVFLAGEILEITAESQAETEN
ncbi:MAG: Fic family protein [Chloroflexia bacterium]